MSKSTKSSICLLLAAIIWGLAFVAQKEGTELIGPFTYSGIRLLIGAMSLIPVILVREKKNREKVESKSEKKHLILGGIACGFTVCFAINTQQIALITSTAGKAGFVTTLYVILVPILSVLIGKKIRGITWICAIIGVTGLYILCKPESITSIKKEDILLIIAAISFACQIMIEDKIAPLVDPIKLSFVQFFTAGVISSILMFLCEEPNLNDILRCAIPILYTGICSTGIAYTLQIVGQRDAEAAPASIIMSMESVFSALFGALILKERLAMHELIGCAIIFIAAITSQLTLEKGKNRG